MTRGTTAIKLTMYEFRHHQYRYVGQDGKPYVLTLDADTGATILAPVEIVPVDDLALA